MYCCAIKDLFANRAEPTVTPHREEPTIRREAERRGWELLALEVDAGFSAKSLSGRPALDAALLQVQSGQADVLVVAKLDRLSRSVADFAALLDQAQRGGWGLVALGPGRGHDDPRRGAGGQRDGSRRAVGAPQIVQRTREGLAARRASGVRLGRPPVLPPTVVQRVVLERRAGLTMQAICLGLAADAVPTARGGAVWRTSTVSALLQSVARRACVVGDQAL